MSRHPASVGGRADTAELKQELLGRLGLRADASDQDVEAAHNGLVDFLELAPHEVKSWAAAQTADVDEAFALLSGPEQDLAPATRLAALAQDPLDGTPPAPSPAPATPTTPTAPATPWTAAARNALRTKLVWAVPVLVVAVVLGVFFMGKSSDVPGISGTPTGQETQASGGAATTPVDKAKVAALMKKISANPTDKVSLQALGDLYFAAADYKNASTWEQKVLGVDPKNEVALLANGAAQFNLGNSAEAKKTWLVAAALYPKSAEVHYDLGFLYMSQTPPDSANMQAEWKKVVAIDPNSNLAKTVATHLKSSAASPTASAAPTK
jgi:tetratricopeptide (TPR) repeat protein